MKKRNAKLKAKIFLGLTIFSLFTMLNSCKDSSEISEPYVANHTEFIIVNYGCGKIIYSEKIGSNYISAYKEIEERKTFQFQEGCPDAPCHEIQLESFKIEVKDTNNNTPEEGFYAIRVIDKKTKLSVQSVAEIITTKGNLFMMQWCGD